MNRTRDTASSLPSKGIAEALKKIHCRFSSIKSYSEYSPCSVDNRSLGNFIKINFIGGVKENTMPFLFIKTYDLKLGMNFRHASYMVAYEELY